MRIQESDTLRKMSIIRVMLSYSQIGYQRFNIKKPTSKERKKPKKGTKYQRMERHYIKGGVIKKHQVC